jgi:hypothetical protein
MGIPFAGIVYLLIGLFVASGHGYFIDLATLNGLLSAAVAVLLWPLVFFGADLHLVL